MDEIQDKSSSTEKLNSYKKRPDEKDECGLRERLKIITDVIVRGGRLTPLDFLPNIHGVNDEK